MSYQKVFSVTDFGAVGDNVADDTAAIQAAITAAGVASGLTGGAVVYLPPGIYQTSSPLLVQVDNVTIRGAGRNASRINPVYGGGPAVLISPSTTYLSFPTTTALATGTGSAMTMASNGQRWLNLRDLRACDVNGLGALCIEFFVKVTVSSNNNIITSRGQELVQRSFQSFSIQYNSNASLSVTLTVGGSQKSITSSAATLPLNTTAHVALTYDGTTVRLFIAGALVGSVAGSGTVTQAPCEDICVGTLTQCFDCGDFNNGIDGAIDSIRISNAAIYTSAFTAPTAKLSSIGSTLLLCNFATFLGTAMVQCTTTYGTGWLVLRNFQNTNQSSNVQIEDMQINSSGNHIALFVTQAYRCVVQRVTLAGRGGIYCWSNTITCYFQDILVALSGHPVNYPGIAILQGSHDCAARNVEVSSGNYPIVVANSGNFLLSSAYLQCDNATILPIFLGFGSGMISTIEAFQVDDENGTSSLYAYVGIDGYCCTLVGAWIANTASVPLTAWGYQSSGSIHGLTALNTSTEVARIISTTFHPNSPIVIQGANVVTGTPLSLTPAYVVGPTVLLSGVGAALASAATIAPTSLIHHVTGTVSVTTITVPSGAISGLQLTLIPDAAVPFATGGNINAALTASTGVPVLATYDAGTSKWYLK